MAQAFLDERTLAISLVFNQIARHGAWVPELWRIEVLNALNVGIRRGRIDAQDRRKVLDHLSSLPILFDGDTHRHCWTRTLQLADRHRLTVYDATYLEMAIRLALPLATLDRELRLAAQAEGIALLGL